jgi:FixJ family two-component response regulator
MIAATRPRLHVRRYAGNKADAMASAPLIAVIDDDGPTREAVIGLVRSMGYAAAGFGSAASFLQSDELARTGCMITDLRMDGMSGLELHRRLVAAGASIPTIVITGYPDEAVRRQALEVGVSGWLAKPVSPEELLRCLRGALGSCAAEP